MESIRQGMSGAAVEDVQDRLASLGYEIDRSELGGKGFGDSTRAAVAAFRADQGLPAGDEVDSACWSVLVDESYRMGDRTLYLRLPNFHGRDVRDLQNALNILGFSCGSTDGYYDAHTESAVKQFQESVGILADGMAFSDTFDAIDRLHHVWNGKPAQGPHPTGGIGFARAAEVLETTPLSISAEDPISRNVAGRVWNLATATSEASELALAETPDAARKDDLALLVLTTAGRDVRSTSHNVVMDEDAATLPARIRTAYESARAAADDASASSTGDEGAVATAIRPTVRIELPAGATYDGTFTARDAQTIATSLLDAICTAFAR